MPELARFYGIIVRMFAETGGQHHRPPIHVYYQENVAVYAIDRIKLLTGMLPGRQRRLVEAWIEDGAELAERARQWERASALR